MKALLLILPFVFSGNPPDGLKRERLPADVDFVVHLDLEGFKQTELWKHVSAGAGEHELDIDELDDIKTRFGIDPLTNGRALTLYKVKSEEDPTVVLFSTTDKVDAALRALQAEPGYARIREGEVELHTWHEAEHPSDGDGDSVYAYLHSLPGGERVVVLASKRSSALHAARVLRGEEPSHAKSGSLLTLAPAPGSFLYLAAADIPHLGEFPPASRVFGLAQGIQVDLGEAGGLLRAHMGLTTGSPEKASEVSRMVDGFIALGCLLGEQIGEAVELLRAMRLNTRGSEVTVDFEFGVARLLEIVNSLDEDEDEETEVIEERKVERR